MRVLYVVECDLPTPEAAHEPIMAMDPPNLPYFAGSIRIVMDPQASALVEWLDETEKVSD